MLVPTELGRIVRIAVVSTLLAALALPALEARAASDLYPGASAVVSSLSGPVASLKAAPDPAAAEVIQVDNGIAATVVAGPLPGVDGLLWYQVEVAGVSGYIAEADLAWGSPEEVVTAPDVEEPAPPVVTGNGVVITADGSDIRCRIAPNLEAEWVFAYTSGSSVDLAGIAVDGWQPVICAAQLGYVPAELVYDPANLPVPAPTETAVVPEVTEVVETPPETETIPEVTETIVVPEDTVTTELPEETETVTIPEETATVEVSETVPATDPTATELVETPTPTETAVATETVIVEVTESPIVETATPEVSATATAETVGQTISVDDSLVVSASIAGSAVVYNTGAGGLRCRSGASLESPVLTVLPLGAPVSLTGPASNGWQPVICGEQAGFVAARFLQVGTETDSGEEPVEAASALTGSSGVVQNTDGDGVRCRVSASYSGSVITVLSEGTTVYSRGAAVGVWQPITCAGRAGWVHTDYLGNGSGGGGTGSTGGTATIFGTDGDGVRFRASAGYDGAVISVLTEGTTVTLRNGSVGSWTAISYGGRNGFVYADFLTTARNPSPGGGGVGGTNLSIGSNARVIDTLNFRSGPSYSAGVVGVAYSGTVVRVTGSPSSGFYPVRWGGVDGYMHGDYLVYTTQGLSTSGPSGGGGAGSGSGSASGQAMVNYAMRYLGYPYVWATHGPNSFDCSGFTYWVTLNVLGRDIGAGTWSQWGTGTPIQYGNLRPGDLVFFQNTYTVGLSHVGIYIGGDQFIHAENENTGVRISSLSSQYYSTRYLGARRLT
jgi:cell wall-associated NlpC family hydrolase